MQNPLLSVRNLCFSYSGEGDGGEAKSVPVIRNISFDIEKGSFVAVLGHNGSGKSTLAQLLNMILTPDSGTILIDGTDITNPDITEQEMYEIRRRIGMVFQNPDNQLVATVVEEDVAFGPENMGVPPAEIRRRVDEALAMVGMTEYAHHAPHQLSGGQKQRIAIAGIIAMMPDCIIFDESTAMLDPSGRREVMQTMEMLNRERGITVLHITHNMEEAIRADRVMVVSDGEIFLDGTPAQVFSHVAELESVGLDVPKGAELIYELTKAGLPFDSLPLSDEDSAQAILQLFDSISPKDSL